jgi:hypothetical protein
MRWACLGGPLVPKIECIETRSKPNLQPGAKIPAKPNQIQWSLSEPLDLRPTSEKKLLLQATEVWGVICSTKFLENLRKTNPSW